MENLSQTWLSFYLATSGHVHDLQSQHCSEMAPEPLSQGELALLKQNSPNYQALVLCPLLNFSLISSCQRRYESSFGFLPSCCFYSMRGNSTAKFMRVISKVMCKQASRESWGDFSWAGNMDVLVSTVAALTLLGHPSCSWPNSQ